ncbi:MAG: cation:dicarboxylase symporter family transporter, partial [Bacteroidales bacterium]|nr:cation:dicarboxylase symporter family transporter [Bacteroidales bacterium]
MFRKLPLYAKILIGMFLGLVFGFLVITFGIQHFATDYIKPFGTIFLNLLKLIAMPLIFASLVSGVSGLSDVSRLSKLGIKTISFYIVTTIIAVTIGLVLVSVIRPGSYVSEAKRVELLEKYSFDLAKRQQAAEGITQQSPLQFLVDIVPENIVNAASNNTSMLQVIFFAILFGVALILVPHSKVAIVKDFVAGLNE